MRRTEGDARDHMGEPLDLGAVGSDVDTTNDGAAIAYCLDTGDTRIEDECVRDRSLDVTVHDAAIWYAPLLSGGVYMTHSTFDKRTHSMHHHFVPS